MRERKKRVRATETEREKEKAIGMKNEKEKLKALQVTARRGKKRLGKAPDKQTDRKKEKGRKSEPRDKGQGRSNKEPIAGGCKCRAIQFNLSSFLLFSR